MSGAIAQNPGASQARGYALRKLIWRTQMSQAFDRKQPSARVHDENVRADDWDLTAVLAMCAVGLALSLIMLALPGWVFQPSDVTSFPLP
jgi:nucleotidyltransferase/DNA polymerase involved in DNA repair